MIDRRGLEVDTYCKTGMNIIKPPTFLTNPNYGVTTMQGSEFVRAVVVKVLKLYIISES